MFKVTEFAFTAYSVTDVPRARSFYEDVLKLPPGMVFDHEGKFWIEYEVGPHVLAITNMSPEWKPSPHGGGVALEVENFDTAIEHLKQRGVKFAQEPFASPVC